MRGKQIFQLVFSPLSRPPSFLKKRTNPPWIISAYHNVAQSVGIVSAKLGGYIGYVDCVFRGIFYQGDRAGEFGLVFGGDNQS